MEAAITERKRRTLDQAERFRNCTTSRRKRNRTVNSFPSLLATFSENGIETDVGATRLHRNHRDLYRGLYTNLNEATNGR
jgi:hypothetical protein